MMCFMFFASRLGSNWVFHASNPANIVDVDKPIILPSKLLYPNYILILSHYSNGNISSFTIRLLPITISAIHGDIPSKSYPHEFPGEDPGPGGGNVQWLRVCYWEWPSRNRDYLSINSMAIFNSYVSHYQRVCGIHIPTHVWCCSFISHKKSYWSHCRKLTRG